MKVYLDNVIVSGRIRSDLEPTELAAVQRLEQPPYRDELQIVTSRESWREQERTHDPRIRAALRHGQADVPVVQNDHAVLGFSQSQDQYGGFVANPLVTDIVDESLFAILRAEGLDSEDARHLMYAVCNGCQRFVTLDPDFLGRRAQLETRCRGLRILKPTELVASHSGS